MRRFLTTIALLCLGAATFAAAAQARPGQQVMFEAPGAFQDPATAVPQLESLGVTAIRVNLRWYDTAPAKDARDRPSGDLTDPAAYDWSRYQPIIDAASERGWKVTLSLAGPAPRWGTEGARDNITRPRASDYQHFAEAAAKQFGREVTQWSIWNEPNFRTFLMPQFVKGKPASPAIYRGLYLAGQKGLKAGSSKTPRILFGETAPRAGADGVAPLEFVRTALCLDSSYKKTKTKCDKITTDGYAHHPYAPPAGPYFAPAKKDDVTIGALSRLTSALDKAAKAGAITGKLKVFLTEFGVQSYPDLSAGVPLSTQSDQRSTAEKIAWSNPRVYGFSQYLMRDDATESGTSKTKRYSGFQSGLMLANGKKKPSYDGFRLPLVATLSGTTKVSLWGIVRPSDGKTRVTVYQAEKGKSWKALKTVSTKSDTSWTLSATNAKNRMWRVMWKNADGDKFYGSDTKAYVDTRK